MRRSYCWTFMIGLFTLAVASAGYAQSSLAAPASGTPVVSTLGSGHVTINVENADITAILRMLSETKKINIISGPEITGLVSVSLHDVPFEDALTAILGVSGFTYYKMGDIYYVTSEAKKKEMPQSASDMMAQTYHVNYAEPKDLLTAVTEFVSPAGKVVLGANKTIIVRDSPASLAIIQDIIKQLDVPTRQVLIAAHIISVNRKNNLEVGAGIDTPPYELYGADVVSSGFSKFAPGVKALSDLAQKAVKSTTTSTTSSTGLTGTSSAAKAGTTGTSSTGSSSSTGSTGSSSSGTNASPGLFVSTLQQDFRAFLDLLEEKANVNILASPEILAVDGQKARIQVGDRLGFRVTTTTTTASLESVEFIEVGTVLEVTPNITDEGVIRMQIHPKVSSGVIGATGLPTESTTEVTTEMIVKDGETIVIGGLLDASKQKSRSQVPILGDIPILGKLFGRNTWIDNKKEVMIMISPKLIGPVASPEMLARIERAKSTAEFDDQGAFWKVTGLEKPSTKGKENREPSMHSFVDGPVKAPLPEQTSSLPRTTAKADTIAPAVIDMSAPVASSNVAKSEVSAPAVLEPQKSVVVASAPAEEEGKSIVAETDAPAAEVPSAKAEESQAAVSEAPAPAAETMPATPAASTPATEAAPVAPEPSVPAAETALAAAPAEAPKGFAIQVATFKGSARQADAEVYKKHLEKKYGIASDAVSSNDDRFVCVLAGNYSERGEANKACRELKKNSEFVKCYVRTRKCSTIQEAAAETAGAATEPRS